MLRLRNVKNKLQIIDSSDYVIKNSEENRGRWYNVFENKNPIEVEIGMGKGDFIVSKALKNPNINYVGIEKADSIVARAIQKIPKNISNLKIVIDETGKEYRLHKARNVLSINCSKELLFSGRISFTLSFITLKGLENSLTLNDGGVSILNTFSLISYLANCLGSLQLNKVGIKNAPS